MLHELLCDTKMPLGALYCHDVFCENHTTDLNEYLDLTVDACTIAWKEVKRIGGKFQSVVNVIDDEYGKENISNAFADN